jgi:predicted AAA+ superfamily ATPase
MFREQLNRILRDLTHKMVFVVGPRQVGKTWLAKEVALYYDKSLYLNYDRAEDREIILSETWLPTTTLLILDEIHKMPRWKQYLKGVFDTKSEHLHILVTGSARLDAFRQAGDSLAGRFFIHHLFPFSPSELKRSDFGESSLERLMTRGGFPEPFLADTDEDANRWRMHYTDSLIREDVLNFENIHSVKSMQLTVDLLRRRVGSPISYTSLAEDVGVSVNSIKKYIHILEDLYIIFRITPFSHNIARSLVRSPKIYFFDTGMVEGDLGVRFENSVAVALLKEVYFHRDYRGVEQELHYLKTKERLEVDFAISEKTELLKMIEVKYRDRDVSKSLRYFHQRYSAKEAIQLVGILKREYVLDDVTVRNAQAFLDSLSC